MVGPVRTRIVVINSKSDIDTPSIFVRFRDDVVLLLVARRAHRRRIRHLPRWRCEPLCLELFGIL